MLQRCLLVYFALSLLLSQVYVPVFKHTCLGMGREWTKALKEPNSCCKKRPRDRPIIQEENKEDHITFERIPCCKDELTYVGIANLASTDSYTFKEDYPGNQNSHSDYSSFPYSRMEAKPCSEQIFQDIHGPPMLRDGVTILKQLQTWRC